MRCSRLWWRAERNKRSLQDMWTASGMPGYGGRVKLIHCGKETQAPTTEHNPPGFSASWIGSSEAESPTETAASVGAAEFSPCRHDEVRTSRWMCGEICWTEDVYVWERLRGDVGFGEVARGMDLGMLLGGVRFLEVQTLSFLLIFS